MTPLRLFISNVQSEFVPVLWAKYGNGNVVSAGHSTPLPTDWCNR